MASIDTIPAVCRVAFIEPLRKPRMATNFCQPDDLYYTERTWVKSKRKQERLVRHVRFCVLEPTTDHMTLREFNELLLFADSEDKRRKFVHKYIFHGIPYVFRGRELDFFEFKSRIANQFKIGFHEVFIVGSGKLGFSYYKGTEFSYDSDIDVVLVNSRLFERYARQICDYQYKLDEAHQAVTQREIRMYREFLQYLIKGWMRPDKLPTSFEVRLLKNEWFDFFDSISSGRSEVGNYKVAAGLYKNYWYLDKYYLQSLTAHYDSLTRRS